MNKRFKKTINWKIYRLLFVLGIISFLLILPYVLTLQASELSQIPVPLPLALIFMSLQTAVLLAVVLFFGLFFAKKNGIGLAHLLSWAQNHLDTQKLKNDIVFALGLGLFAGILIIIGDALFSRVVEPFATTNIVLWKSFLASFYGGIFEEILLRLGVVSFFIWILSLLTKTRNNTAIIWIAIILAAILFGLGHLPATALITEVTPLVVLRAIVLNGVGGVIYGWLFWRKGLLMAMLSHFTTDLILLIVFPLLTTIS